MAAKRVTSLDVARRAGVSRTTVSFVLNAVAGMQISEETRQRVLDAARDLGYVPDAAAQALAKLAQGRNGQYFVPALVRVAPASKDPTALLRLALHTGGWEHQDDVARFGRRGERVAALGLVAVLSRQPNVDVLPGPVT